MNRGLVQAAWMQDVGRTKECGVCKAAPYDLNRVPWYDRKGRRD